MTLQNRVTEGFNQEPQSNLSLLTVYAAFPCSTTCEKTSLSHHDLSFQAPEVNLVSGDYYLDGPVFLKSGISLVGIVSDDAPGTGLNLHGSGTGADGVVNADGVSGALVSTYQEIGGS